MNPDFTLIWPLSCLKDGDHLCSTVTLTADGRAYEKGESRPRAQWARNRRGFTRASKTPITSRQTFQFALRDRCHVSRW